MFTIQNIALILSVLLTALVSGLFYGYACSVNPGLGKLNDAAYLSVMQSINQSILNPYFFLSFMGALIVLPFATWLCYAQPLPDRFYLLLLASLCYLIGTFGITAFGNVPLNEALADFDIANATASELAHQRKIFEEPWNRLHLIRTLSSILSLLLTIVSLLKNNKDMIYLFIFHFLFSGMFFSTEEKSTIHIVRMEGMEFKPKRIEIKIGDRVKWINECNASHNVVASDGSFKSELLHNKGEIYEYTFNKEGSYSYYCNPHKMMGMKGIVIVGK